MKPLRLLLPAAVITAAVVLLAPPARPQGSLTPPPGVPQPAMKSLDQIASTGIPLNATTAPGNATALYVINDSGSYYLTGNLTGTAGKNGILVNAPNVTLDLNGFNMTGGGLSGITDGGNPHPHTVIRNGRLIGWPVAGIDFLSSAGTILENLTLRNNILGVRLGNTSRAEALNINASSDNNLVCGNSCSIFRCSSDACLNGSGFFTGTRCVLRDCTADTNKLDGFQVDTGCTLTNLEAGGNTGRGIVTGDDTTLTACTASQNKASGLSCGNACTLTGCTTAENGSDDTSSGIFTGTRCTLTGCTACNNSAQYGILVNPGSTLIHCTASGNVSSESTSAGIFTAASILRECTANNNLTNNPTPTGTTGMGLYSNGSAVCIENCLTFENDGDGIRVVTSSMVRNNLCTLNAAGIHATGSSNTITGNQLVANAPGVLVDTSGNLITGNCAHGNFPDNYSIAAGNRTATIVTPATNAAISGNTGGNPVSNDAFANVAY